MTPRMGSRAILDDARLLPSAEDTEIMGMPATRGAITSIEELLALPEDGMRHELLDGVHAVTPAAQYLHQKAVVEHEFLVLGATRDRTDAEVLASPADIALGPETLLQPDAFVVRKPPEQPIRGCADVRDPL